MTDRHVLPASQASYIAITKTNFVDGICAADSPDVDQWLAAMAAAGLRTQLVDRREARLRAFTHLPIEIFLA